jgi:hypothetical protein
MLLRQAKNRLRPAATLTEVLVAIFIMGIGLLALLSLFPLGALSMAQAIKDDRTAHAAKNAFAVAELFNIHNDPYVYPQAAYQYPQNALISDGYVNPLPGVMPPLADPTKPSYPVYVDPYAFSFLGLNALQPLGQTVGNTGGIGISRRSPALATNLGSMVFPISNQPTVRWFTLLDDVSNFQDNAAPVLAPLPLPPVAPFIQPTVQRANRYSWAYMLRRPKSGDPTVVDVSVVVYSGRSLSILGETAYSTGVDPATLAPTQGVRFDPSLKYVDVSFPVGQAPPVRRGSWILDATVVVPTNPPQPDPHGFFYRVVEVTDLGTVAAGTNAFRLELQTSPKAASFVVQGGNVIPYGVLIVMENVVEVFDKGQGWKP